MNWGKLIDGDKLGGWVRAFVASILASIVARNPTLGQYIDPVTQASISASIAGIAVGVWSQLTKSDAAKVQMAAAVESVTRIETTDPKLAAMPAPEVRLAK